MRTAKQIRAEILRIATKLDSCEVGEEHPALRTQTDARDKFKEMAEKARQKKLNRKNKKNAARARELVAIAAQLLR